MGAEKIRIIITGFRPFGGRADNPSGDMLKYLPDNIAIDGGEVEIVPVLLPVEFVNAFLELKKAIDEILPHTVIATGLAESRKAVTPEARAYNLMNARIPDNAGFMPMGEPIDPEGPEALPSTLPLEKMLPAISGTGMDAQVSEDPGRYVCNDLFYRLMRYASGIDGGRTFAAGFVHLPDEEPERLARAVAACAKACAETLTGRPANAVPER